MVLVIGEILFDLFPSSKRIGGAPFNFAFHMKNLGFPVRFISRVGDDDNGREILDFIDSHGFDPEDIQIDRAHPTGSVKVNMSQDGSHTFSIIKDTAYDHIDYDRIRQSLKQTQPDIIYFGTLIQRTQNSFENIQKLLSRKPQKTMAFCDINLRPGCYTEQTLKASVKAADILKLNTDELEEIISDSDKSESDEEPVRRLMKTCHLKTIILTMGEKGSKWFTPERVYTETPEKNIDIADTVGAGDAYAAMSAAGILSSLPFEYIPPLAGQFASQVCEVQGALLFDPKLYREFKNKLEEHHEK